jgi:hypothetical protein
MRLRGPSRTQAHPPRVDTGSTRPVRRFHTLRALSKCAIPQPKLRAALHGLPLLFRARSPGPRAVSPVARQVRRHFLSWTFRALRHSLRPAASLAGSRSLRYRVPRAGFGYPLRDLTTGPPDASSASERPWASPFKGFPSPRSVPLSEPLPSCRCRVALRLPGGQRVRCWPASGPCSRDESVLTPEPPKWFRPSIPSWVSSLQSILPFDLALALIAAPPPSS